MLLENERKEIIVYGKKMITDGLTRGTGGNISICDAEQKLMAITPSGIDYFKLTPEDIVIIDVETGKIVDGNRVPSSESDMHRIFYKYKKGVFSVVHTHSKYATAISCTEYATYGTVKLAKNAFKAMKDKKAVLLSNHGMIAIGKNLTEAYNIAENVEFCSELFCISKSIGSPKILDKEEMLNIIERFKDYGKRIEEHEEI